MRQRFVVDATPGRVVVPSNVERQNRYLRTLSRQQEREGLRMAFVLALLAGACSEEGRNFSNAADASTDVRSVEPQEPDSPEEALTSTESEGEPSSASEVVPPGAEEMASDPEESTEDSSVSVTENAPDASPEPGEVDAGRPLAVDSGSLLPMDAGASMSPEVDAGGEPGADSGSLLPTDAGTDAGTAMEAAVPEDRVAPEVIFFSPETGTTQLTEQLVVVQFSEPVEPTTVSAAFPGATLEWSMGGRRVEISTPFPFLDVPSAHIITLPTTITDLAGNGLAEEYQSVVTLAALRRVTLTHQSSRSGNQCEGDTAQYSFVVAGDECAVGSLNMAGISFALEPLPAFASVLEVRQAWLRTQVIFMDGDPNSAEVGGFVADHVVFPTRELISRVELIQPTFATVFDAGEIELGAAVGLEVTDQFALSWSGATSEDDYFQLRIRSLGTDSDGIADRVYFRRASDENDGIVAAGLDEPDENNFMRLEVEYFQ